MLGFLSRKKTIHPLTDNKELDRVLTALPSSEASAAIDEVTAWSESLRALETFQADWLLGVLMRLDEVVRPQVRRLTRDYHGMPTNERSRQFRLWQIGRDYWREVAAAYLKGVTSLPTSDKSLRPQACARGLHAMRQLWKWNQYRYGPHEADFWPRVGQLWLASNDLTETPVPLYGATQSNVTHELLKLIMLHASSTDSLLPQETEIAERLIDHFGVYFTLSSTNEGMSHQFEPGEAPRRMQKQPVPGTTTLRRYFAAGKALEVVRALHLRLTASSELPREIDFGAQYAVRAVLPVLEHLEICWSQAAPERRYERFPVKSTAEVVRGLTEVVQRLEGVGEGQQTWLVRDLSRGGMRLAAPTGGNQWL